MKTKLLLLLLCVSALSFSQPEQPTVHNATFDNIAKSSGSSCTCSGWINKDIADQGESSSLNGSDVGKYDNLESDGHYQEVAVVANSNYTLDLEYTYDNSSATTTNYIEIIVLKGSEYLEGYTPAYDVPADAAQSGFGYDTISEVETAANQLARSETVYPGDDGTYDITQMTFNTGTETSIAIFIRAVGPYNETIHGDPTKNKGWMNGDSEVRIDNLALVNTTNLSVEDELISQVRIYPNPSNGVVNIQSNNAEITSISVYDLLGKQVFSTDKLVNQINLSGLNHGVYVLNVQSGNRSAIKKIIIE